MPMPKGKSNPDKGAGPVKGSGITVLHEKGGQTGQVMREGIGTGMPKGSKGVVSPALEGGGTTAQKDR